MSSLDDDLADLDTPSEDDDPVFDGDVAALLRDAMDHEQRCSDMRKLGERMGALHAGLVMQGVLHEDATGIVHDWMRCAVFREVDRETGTHEM